MKVTYIASVVIFLSVPFFQVQAQLCQGSLGDPIVNIDFGSGSNPGAPLSAATTSYQYVSSDCPGDGFYTVRNSTSACFGNSWHTLNRDHTGNSNGYFMLVNASLQPSAFYLDTVRGLCSGTTFEFAAWVMNVLLPGSCSPNPAQPNLTFTISKTDGTVLQTYNTGTIPSKASSSWGQFGFFFTTPVGVSDIVLRIFNNAAGGCGNDLALDDITFRPCGPRLTPAIVSNTGTTANVCVGTDRTFTFNCAVSAGFNNPSFQWQQSVDGGPWTDVPAATGTSLIRNFPASTPVGKYQYRVAAAEAGNMSSVKCRIVSDILHVNIVENPVATISSNSPVCEKAELSLSAAGGVGYQWSGPGGFSVSGSTATVGNLQMINAGVYTVEVANAEGCTNTANTTVVVNPAPTASNGFLTATICAGESISLSASGGIDYEWQPVVGLSSAAISDPVASPADTITYSLIVSNQFACRDTTPVLINVIENPRADAGPDKVVVAGTPVQLQGNVYGQNLSYAWTPDRYISNTADLQPIVTPPGDTTYVLTVTSADGCPDATDTVQVLAYKGVFIPNAFSPNADGLNDTWQIPALAAFPGFSLSVFNRAGQLIFHTRNVADAWDGRYKGTMQPMGAYVYLIELNDGTGGLLKGTVMLVR